MSEADFKKAVADSKKLTSKPTNDHLLEMYALYKQALADPTFDKAEQPGMFDLKAKAKYRAWKKIADEGITKEEAKEKYIKLIEEMKETYGYDETKDPEAVGGA